jgi:hypothetical protein
MIGSSLTRIKILKDPEIVSIKDHLRQLCSDGEAHLERYWVEKITEFDVGDRGMCIHCSKHGTK